MEDTKEKKFNNIDNLDTDCEMNYLSQEEYFLSIFCGIKGSSKTFTCLNMIKYYYVTGRYDVIHYISPTRKIDSNQEQFEFFDYIDPKKMTVYAYDKFSPVVIERILKMHSDKKKKVLVILDDATSSAREISINEDFLYFVSCSRHLFISVSLIVHNLRKVLSPTIRAMCDFFFLYRIINAKLLQAYYDEYLSVFPKWRNFREFQEEYYERILNEKFNGLYYDCRESKLDWNIKRWNINNYDFPEIKSGKERQKIKEIHIDKDKDAILKKLEKREMEDEIKRKIMKQSKK